MRWTYCQSTGRLENADHSRLFTGYSGNGEGLNNPQMDQVRGIGPLPAGTWTCGPLYDHPELGPDVRNLIPGPDAHAPERDLSTFRAHGDNAKRNKSASHGCLVLPHEVRVVELQTGDQIVSQP